MESTIRRVADICASCALLGVVAVTLVSVATLFWVALL